jgi:hypothetical protein
MEVHCYFVHIKTFPEKSQLHQIGTFVTFEFFPTKSYFLPVIYFAFYKLFSSFFTCLVLAALGLDLGALYYSTS